MKCNKLFKDSIGIIDFRYKLDDTVQELLDNQPNAKMTKDQFLGYLAGKGVSANEIKVSGIQDWLTGYFGNTKGAKPVENFLKAIKNEGGHYITGNTSKEYSEITYDELGRAASSDYKAKLLSTRFSSGIHRPHFSSPTDIIGWNRVHTAVDEDAKPVLMLNEIQSDWLQGERLGTINGNKFPMSPDKFYQLSIVDAIDEATARNLDTILIPIQRTENSLFGTNAITTFYKNLGNKVLPELTKKLKNAGLNVSFEKVKDIPDGYQDLNLMQDDVVVDYMLGLESYLKNLVNNNTEYNPLDNSTVHNYMNRLKEAILQVMPKDRVIIPAMSEYVDKKIREAIVDYKINKDSIENLIFDISELNIDQGKDIANIISMEPVDKFWKIKLNNVDKEKPIKWNIYSILPTLGISKATYDKLKKEESR
ncbi:MAG: hypothetical protein AB7D38_12165 [Sulfurimonas sp.]|uniref:hypothetical protein n=1 Tax=Sulfurimonas sp. TaxID=2022749 RepID=UPI003D0DAFD4